MNDSSQSQLPEQPAPYGERDLAPPEAFDPVIDAFKRDVDRTLLRENLRLTPEERSRKFVAFMKGIYEMRGKANPNLKVWR